MKQRLLAILMGALASIPLFSSNSIPMADTIKLEMAQVEGRWINEDIATNTKDIYIFRADSTFHKADDTGELLFFNVAGRYKLENDSIKIFYQDFSRGGAAGRVRTMFLQIIALSDNELNINLTERGKTRFVRLRRQN